MIVGLEIHVQINTRSKLFCACPTEKSDVPNKNVCPICLGLPGSRPMLNKEALLKALKVARILNCKINRRFFFSRKVYFYPDLPKNFQITQYEIPIGFDGVYKGIRIKRVHLEEDPARIYYKQGILKSEYSLIDYNRSGIPLVEIVTYPDFRSAEDVEEFLRSLVKELEYFEIFNPKKNTWRVDINVSLEKGYRVEIKNVSGFKNVVRAIVSEVARQRMLLRIGKAVKREVRIWDEVSNKTVPIRRKELEEEYGYILEPDLPFFEVSDEVLKEIDEEISKRPEEVIESLVKERGISRELAESIVYNKLLEVYKKACELVDPKRAAIFVGNYLVKSLNYLRKDIKEIDLERFYRLLRMLGEGKVSDRYVKEAIKWICEEKEIEIKKYDVEEIVCEFFKERRDLLDEMKKNERVIDYVVGEILKRTQYSVDPREVRKKILEMVENNIF